MTRSGRQGAVTGLPWRRIAFAVTLLVYVALTVAVLVPSPLLDLDGYLRGLHLKHNNPQFAEPVAWYVLFGQRGPATLAFLPFFIWRAWRERSPRPLVMLGTALVLLNVSVGIMKMVTGRIGPFDSKDTYEVFAGGNIYPSGHVSNVVVLYGLIAWLSPKFRKTLVGIAIWLSVTVGFGTVYLRTHWVSDVFGGWVAGLLVLIALPWVMPLSERVVNGAIRRYRARRARESRPVPAPGVRRPASSLRTAPVEPHRARVPSEAPSGPRVPIP